MAVYSTAENKKDEYLEQTLRSLQGTVSLDRHRIFLSVNAGTAKTGEIIARYRSILYHVIYNGRNLGTAEAINKAWQFRGPGEHAIKMDDDVVIHHQNWADELEAAVQRDPTIGICGLKRKDCIESPWREDFYKSELYMLPHQPGEPWIIGERVNHVMGTAQLYSSALLELIGYLYQPGLYGFDDVFAAIRCKVAGFHNVFLPHINIDHLDRGDTDYQKWKESHTSEQWTKYQEIAAAYKQGTKHFYYSPFEKEML